jgi:hypothetical protein
VFDDVIAAINEVKEYANMLDFVGKTVVVTDVRTRTVDDDAEHFDDEKWKKVIYYNV